MFTKFKETEFTNIQNGVHIGQNPVTRVKTLFNIVKFYNSEQHFDSSQLRFGNERNIWGYWNLIFCKDNYSCYSSATSHTRLGVNIAKFWFLFLKFFLARRPAFIYILAIFQKLTWQICQNSGEILVTYKVLSIQKDGGLLIFILALTQDSQSDSLRARKKSTCFLPTI